MNTAIDTNKPFSSTTSSKSIIAIFGGGIAALVILMFASLCFGEAKVSVSTVIASLQNRQDLMDHNLVWDIRMPRMILGLLTGAGLAIAGALLQTITKNPLAATDTLGINGGAYFMVVLGTIFFPAILHQSPFLIAVLGGTAAAMAAYILAGGKASSPIRLALSGMIVSLVLGSFTNALHIFYAYESQSLFLWGAGSLNQLDWSGVQYAWPWTMGAVVLAFLFGKQFDVLNLDEATARSLGQKVDLTRFLGLALSVLMAAVVVSVAGPIGFVGLVAPHLVRLSGLRSHRLLIPATALWGAVLITGADVLARMVRSGMGEVPVGAVMAVIGAPWLIWLVLRKMKGISGSAGSVSMSVLGQPMKIRYTRLAVILLVLVIALILVSLTMGATQVPIRQLWASLIGSDSAASYSVIINLRLPRTLVSAGAGIALAVSGVLIQSTVRNPLADASIIGITSGAGFGALAVLIAWPQLPISLLPIAAIIGAVGSAAIVFAFAWRKALNPSVLILLGIAVSAIGAAGIQVLIVRGSLWGSTGFIWLTGTTYGRNWDQVITIALFLLVLLPIAWSLGRRFDLLGFGDDSSVGFGLPVRGTRLAAMAVGVLLAAGAVACVGTIGFLGLMAPHAVRILIGHNTRRSIVLSGLLGALLLVLADTVGRTVMAPKEIPSGILITLLGAPYFLFIMFRTFTRRA
ncbi:iron ABC transporter permease [Paenibacillus nasutitermitis]|uniref:Fe3+-hydroxamate ABC transporter permease FhuB n=1 Tax=Paenibacillus nasutitermitis TaxID=1652958 RepID=A0A916ZE13_9BACL|nr:iron ABC transporter permease [Paenibacillus nasutitermitis]GGD91453.1 Fe3+-hydroxamate ABC transporter permease FhuB [Paenibacillus nasutitermitis]